MTAKQFAKALAATACAVGCAMFSPASAAEALVAVAANFRDAADQLEADFEAASPHRITLATGSTGKLYAQIVNGAPYDILLAADRARPARLEESRFAVAGLRFTYAIGRLVLWSADPDLIGPDGAATLQRGEFRRLAIANPDLAPYGAAAMQVLQSLGLAETLTPKIVQGENIGQTFALISTRGADLGFVALSYALSPRNETRGAMWSPPADLYDPIRQDAVLLSHGAGNDAAAAFLDYLKSDEARATIRGFGYGFE